jgi:hypothetical protein
MITQLLGVALISLLTITPTIQQNNIEQLIAPNIEIQDNLALGGWDKNIYVPTSFVIYLPSNITSRTTTFLKFSQTIGNPISVNNFVGGVMYIQNDNFYINAANTSVTGNQMRSTISDYYLNSRGTTPTVTVSFTQTTANITSTNTFYTFTANGSSGEMSGRIYVINGNDVDQNTGSVANNNITVPVGTSLEQIINLLQPSIVWENQSQFSVRPLWYYFHTGAGDVAPTGGIDTSISGSYTRNLRVVSNFGYSVPLGSVTINVANPDTTPPVINSITGNPIDWTNQDVTLTINATDDVALGDLNTPPYSFDNGATFQFSNNKTFTTNEIVNVRVRDLAGNFTNQQVIINRIDKQSPAVTLPQGWVSSYPVNTITAQQLLATYNISDGASGVNTSLTTILNFNPTVIGAYNPLISVTDNAGNTFNYTSPTVNITQPADSTGPVITGPTSLTYQLGTITANSIIQQYNISDVSGIEPNSISIRNTSNQIITNFNLAIGSYSLNIYARDTLQNETNYPITLIVQDTVAPVITGNTVQQLVVNRTQQDLIDRFNISDDSDITVEIIGNINYGLPGNYSVTLRATDSVGNITNLSITVNITLPDITGPLISGAFGISVEVGLFNDNQQFINQYFTITDPSGIKSTVLTGTLDFNVVGSYNVILVATDNEDNVSNRQLTIKVYDPINLADYNPLTDLFSGIFGGLLSMIFTIGTINLLGFRLLDAMALIILGSVIWLVYKAIKGGS